MDIILSLVPVFIFLMLLAVFDSFKLVKPLELAICVFWGIFAAFASWMISKLFIGTIIQDFSIYSRYFAPVIEEILKAAIICLFIYKNRIGFMIDGGIFGFAVGAGFALFENIFYLNALDDYNLLLWAARGFGTAVMHGGTSALFGITAMQLIAKEEKISPKIIIISLIIPVILHSVYNHFILSPILSTLLIMTITPALLIAIFLINEKKLRKWLEIELSSEVTLLSSINKGQFSGTKAGKYIISIKEKFPAVVVFDMICFIKLYLELSIRAKSIMLLKETGFSVKEQGFKSIEPLLAEFKSLKSNIGKTGMLALAPILRMSYKDLWKINMLE